MNKKRLSLLLVLLCILCVAGTVLSAVMAVMAVRFSEWGRVLVYGVAAIVCLEAALLAAGRLRNKDNA